MNIQAETYGNSVVLVLRGELNVDSLGAFKQSVDHHLAEMAHKRRSGSKDHPIVDLVLDLEKVPFVDSAALEYLLELQERLAEGLGQIKLVRPDEHVLKILEITRLRSTFDVFADVPEAAGAAQT